MQTLLELPADRVIITHDGPTIRLEVCHKDVVLMGLTFDGGMLKIAGSALIWERWPALAPFFKMAKQPEAGGGHAV